MSTNPKTPRRFVDPVLTAIIMAVAIVCFTAYSCSQRDHELKIECIKAGGSVMSNINSFSCTNNNVKPS